MLNVTNTGSEACHCVVQHLGLDMDKHLCTAIFRAFTLYGVKCSLFCLSGKVERMAEIRNHLICFVFLLPTRLPSPADVETIKVIIEENFH